MKSISTSPTSPNTAKLGTVLQPRRDSAVGTAGITPVTSNRLAAFRLASGAPAPDHTGVVVQNAK